MTTESSQPVSGRPTRKRRRNRAAPGARILAVGLSISASITLVNALADAAPDGVAPGEAPLIADSSNELPSAPPPIARSSRTPITTSQAS